MKVSVCMITFNHEAFIAQAIESVLMQETDFDIELVIGEDCSSDDTGRICLDYQKKHPERIKLLLGERNLGMILNFLRTFRACDGKYVAFCEGDDFWTDHHKLQKQVNFLEHNPDFGMVHTACDWLDQVSGKLTRSTGIHEDRVAVGNIFHQLLASNFIFTVTVCARTELVMKGVETLKENVNAHWRMADYPLWLEVSTCSKVGYLDEPMAVYRNLPESASHSRDKQKLMEFISSLYEVKSYFMAKYSVDDKTTSKIIDVYNSVIARLALQFRDSTIAEKYVQGGPSRLTLRQKFHVLGSKNSVLRFMVRVCLFLFRSTGIAQRTKNRFPD